MSARLDAPTIAAFIPWAIAFILVILFLSHSALTLYWVYTGHCCGDPVFTSNWDDCLPIQDHAWYAERGWVKGHCDKDTWKRVVP
jgi:hypothetical protein